MVCIVVEDQSFNDGVVFFLNDLSEESALLLFDNGGKISSTCYSLDVIIRVVKTPRVFTLSSESSVYHLPDEI